MDTDKVMRVVTWNVNSIRKREEIVADWLRLHRPDVVLLQETKVIDDKFPRERIEALGYNLAIHGQPGLNGVAILSRHAIDDVRCGLDGEPGDDQARYIEARCGWLRVASIYVPNGTSIDSDKFDYKMRFFTRMEIRFRELMDNEEAFVLGGDYNVAPDPVDVYDPDACAGDICYHMDERRAFRRLLGLGITDAFRAVHPTRRQFSWWDMRGGSWDRDEGMRIDHLLLSPEAVDRLDDADADPTVRAGKGVSDHIPVWCNIASAA